MQLRERKHRRRAGRTAVAALAGAAALLTLVPATGAAADSSHDDHGGNAATYAVFGDSPYGQPLPTGGLDHAELDATPAFIDTINADPQVDGVIHVGDIHSGSEPCTKAYDDQIAADWQGFEDPLYYTPGDNEWADCQKTKQLPQLSDIAKGDPIANLDYVRNDFFPQAGVTLGQHKLPVLSQAQVYDPAFPTDAQYVENTIWKRSDIVFVTVNIPGGSQNDHDVWNSFTTGTTSLTQAQIDEYTNRTAADLRWLDTAFGMAIQTHAKGVVVLEQADLWDAEKAASGITQYEPFVAKIADRATAYGGPVLLINGDTHIYRSDSPLVNGADCTFETGAVCPKDAYDQHLPVYDVPNLHRVVVHGNTVPMEWLKLKIDPSADAPNGPSAIGPFSWSRQTQQLP
jgi:hypothetical protein